MARHTPLDDSSRSRLILQLGVIGIAVFAAIVALFAYSSARSSVADVALTVLPVVVAVAPLVLPARFRNVTALIVAVLLSLYLIPLFDYRGVWFLPAVMVQWVAAIVPWQQQRGTAARSLRVWRVLGVIVLLLPLLLLISGMITGALDAGGTVLPLIIYTAVILTLSVLFAMGRRYGYLLVAVLGLAVMILGVLQGGLFVAAAWWIGGLWFAIGQAAFAASLTQSASHRVDTSAAAR